MIGIFGNNTKTSVINFQKSWNIAPSGVVNYLTWNALFPYIDGYFNYSIKYGDTAYKLAQKFNITLAQIIFANPGLDIQNLSVGQKVVIPLGSIVRTDVSYTYDLLQLNKLSLQVVYPFIQVGTIGTSVLGREISLLKIGSGPKEVFYSGAFHANEWITAPLLMKFVEDCARQYVLNGNIFNFNARELFKNVSLYIVPMVNPDGVDLVTGNIPKSNKAYISAQNIANNFPDIAFPNGWKANIRGVDLKNFQPFCKVL